MCSHPDRPTGSNQRVDDPTYRVYVWDGPWSGKEWEITQADIDEVLEWIRANGRGRPHSLWASCALSRTSSSPTSRHRPNSRPTHLASLGDRYRSLTPAVTITGQRSVCGTREACRPRARIARARTSRRCSCPERWLSAARETRHHTPRAARKAVGERDARRAQIRSGSSSNQAAIIREAIELPPGRPISPEATAERTSSRDIQAACSSSSASTQMAVEAARAK